MHLRVVVGRAVAAAEQASRPSTRHPRVGATTCAATSAMPSACSRRNTHDARPLVVTSRTPPNARGFYPRKRRPRRRRCGGAVDMRDAEDPAPPHRRRRWARTAENGRRTAAAGWRVAARGPGRRRPPRRGRRGGSEDTSTAPSAAARQRRTSEAAEHAGRPRRQAPDTDDPRAQVRARKSRAPAAPHASRDASSWGSRSPDSSTRAPGTSAATAGPKAPSPPFTTTTNTGARRTACRWRTTWTTTA